MALPFTTKAGTLATLSGNLQSAYIPQAVAFAWCDWVAQRQAELDRVSASLGKGPWIVRSSCLLEDSLATSNAGAFLSLPNIGQDGLGDAIDQVFQSYGRQHPDDQVLIQPMLKHVCCSGVAFSHDPNTCAPYRVVNWAEGPDTAAITGGMGGKVWQQAALSRQVPPQAIAAVIPLLDELLALFGQVPVDCEFAVTREADKEVLWLLQARPLVLPASVESPARQASRLEAIQHKIAQAMAPQPFLMGQRTVFGVMPDWNPAEIVGVRPKPLALSLYKDLVTDAIWAYQRHNYGYRNLRSFPLMPNFFGLPYIDVRLSFNSFIPDDLDEGLAGRLVDYYIDRLLADPALHDKVEFEIVFSCYTLDLPQRLERLLEAGFSRQECDQITHSLRKLTNRIVHPKDGLWRADAEKLATLESRRKVLQCSGLDSLGQIYWLLEDAKRYGTLPFAGLARAGFIAIQMLKSLVSVGVFSQSDYDGFVGGVSTVSGQLARDRAHLDRATFLSRYGHLRPGTYDVLSPRYDEAPDLYFDWAQRPQAPDPVTPFSLTLPQMREIVALLREHGLQPDPVGLFDFMQAGIELRELAKFKFTRNLSDALALMVNFGVRYGFSRDDMAYCDVSIFHELYAAATDPVALLQRSIDQGRVRYADTLRLSLPPLIVAPEDIWAFQWPDAVPNFITQKQVVACVAGCDDRDALAGSIVCIPNADPGFDWLFSYPIAGLVTAWGGVNSHMAIRAGELGLPAVIGAGEILYKRWSVAHRLHIDCAGRRVDILA